ncbi:MAG: phytoene desaturase family protein [Acidimicrobiales bacterium]
MRQGVIPDEIDVAIVGSGVNSLVAGALLAEAGWSVCVVEQSSWLGGAMRTAEITRPGFHHDLFSAWHPLFVLGDAYARLGPALEARGLDYRVVEEATATLYPDGGAAFLTTSLGSNVTELNRHAPDDGEAWRQDMSDFEEKASISFGLLSTELASLEGARLGLRAGRELGASGGLEFAGELLGSARTWLTSTFASPRVHGLFAPWVLHTGLGPDAASSGFMGRAIASVLQSAGLPVPAGGSEMLAKALVQLISDRGGSCHPDTPVERVMVTGGRATGIEIAGGGQIRARRAVIANVTPGQLYGGLLPEASVPSKILGEARRYRLGRAGMQIHFALSRPPAWRGDERLASTPVVHLTPGLDAVSKAVSEAERSLLPETPTIVCGQPCAVDSSRAPEGSSIFWIQLQEVPRRPIGDAGGSIETGDGAWTETLRERYADRIQARLTAQIEDFESTILERVALSPADLEAANVNLEQGDIYSGSCELDQNFLWRPRPGLRGHRTHIDGLWHLGASTHPGPGLGGGSGSIVARQLLGEDTRGRQLAKKAVRAAGKLKSFQQPPFR